MNESVHFMSKRSDWATPQDLFDKIMLKYDPWVDSDKPVIF